MPNAKNFTHPRSWTTIEHFSIDIFLALHKKLWQNIEGCVVFCARILRNEIFLRLKVVMLRFKCAIEKVSDWHPHLFLEAHIVACVAVMHSHSASPAVFEVTCENIFSDWLGEETQFMLEVSWSEETERKAERLWATIQTKPIVEMAASALAFILTPNIVNLGQLDVTNFLSPLGGVNTCLP